MKESIVLLVCDVRKNHFENGARIVIGAVELWVTRRVIQGL
jgi:hypothetical protein